MIMRMGSRVIRVPSEENAGVASDRADFGDKSLGCLSIVSSPPAALFVAMR